MISKVLRPKAWASRTTNLHSWGVNRREADLGIDKTDTILFAGREFFVSVLEIQYGQLLVSLLSQDTPGHHLPTPTSPTSFFLSLRRLGGKPKMDGTCLHRP